MATHQVLTTCIVSALLVVVAVGLLVRQRVDLCWSFFAYQMTILTTNLMMRCWPERFYNTHFDSMKDTVVVVLKILVGLEIWQRTFSAFPRARVRVGLLLVGVLALTAVAARTAPTDGSPFFALLVTLAARHQAGMVWVLAVVGASAAWYRVPLHPLHRLLLIGFAAYSILWIALLSLMGVIHVTMEVFRWTSAVEAAGFGSVQLLWSWAAWRPLREPSPIVSRLQPWARSW
jgi:hypothetical protein